MTIFIIITIWTLLGAALYAAIRGNQHSLESMDELDSLTVPVDIEAFSNLMSKDLTNFITTRLKSGDQRTARKMRSKAAIGYVASMASNAALLIHATNIAKQSKDPAVREKAQHLQVLAIKLRVLSLITLMKLQVVNLIPVSTNWNRLAGDYKEIKESVQFLTLAMQSKRMSTIQEAL